MKTIYDFQVKLPNGEEKSLQEYEGRPLIIVNTASKCGFTPQFKGLQTLYDTYKDHGLEILGFPCSQFNNQEYDQIEKTTEFCQVNYGVTFPIFAKVEVNGSNADPLFKFLKEQKTGILSSRIKWNFTKFLVNRDGQVMKRYAPAIDPSSIQADLVKLLS
ncbi:glutathione peroxidase [Neobacillus soli]|uniref:glutathione peroxidase n=1 Tax=Neobacillus soli TaxID=220688 RepID=UPI0008244D9D|nr:glutathione peroxidase [Neobacillus soli]